VLLVATAVGGLAAFWAAGELFSRGSAGTPEGAGAVEISAATDRVLREVSLSAPNDVETGFGAAFVTGTTRTAATVSRVPAGPTREPRRIELARATATSPDDLAVGSGAVWATVADALYRADPRRLSDTRRVSGLPGGGLLSGVAVGAGGVWVADATRRAVYRVDPAGRRATVEIPLPGPADGVAVGGGRVWVASAQDGSVFEVDPRRARVERSIAVAGATTGIAAGAGAVWVTAASRDAIARIDPGSGRVDWTRVGAAPTDVCVSRGSIWVANSGSSSVSRIDAATRRVAATIRVPARPNRIATDGRSVWATFLGRPPGGD
jgi:YVTN family beta-propeller protein